MIPTKRVGKNSSFVPKEWDFTCRELYCCGQCVFSCRLRTGTRHPGLKGKFPISDSLTTFRDMTPSGFPSWALSSHCTWNLPYWRLESRARTVNVCLYWCFSRKWYVEQAAPFSDSYRSQIRVFIHKYPYKISKSLLFPTNVLEGAEKRSVLGCSLHCWGLLSSRLCKTPGKKLFVVLLLAFWLFENMNFPEGG